MSWGLLFYILAFVFIGVSQTREFRLRFKNGKSGKGRFWLETLQKLILAGIFPWLVVAYHESMHGVGALIEGKRFSEITWWPFTGIQATLVGGERPGFFFYFGPCLFECGLFVAFFLAHCFFKPAKKIPKLLISLGMGIPLFDTVVATSQFFVRKTDFRILATLFPGPPYFLLFLFLIGFYCLGFSFTFWKGIAFHWKKEKEGVAEPIPGGSNSLRR